jgi:hypothetical protein
MVEGTYHYTIIDLMQNLDILPYMLGEIYPGCYSILKHPWAPPSSFGGVPSGSQVGYFIPQQEHLRIH